MPRCQCLVASGDIDGVAWTPVVLQIVFLDAATTLVLPVGCTGVLRAVWSISWWVGGTRLRPGSEGTTTSLVSLNVEPRAKTKIVEHFAV
jgi:hypothetical protein